ncbi:MAG: TonB-dependent receptor [Bacteroidetes bacterium]|nr:TonB-dependent receptor [Bacteroidota bacterium]
MIFRLYSLAFLLFFSFQIQGQTARLFGKVTDELQVPLVSANIVVDVSKGIATVTDFDGKYEVGLPAGTYQVLYAYLGRVEQRMTITLVAGEDKEFNVVLTKKQQMMDAVVVTGSKYEKRLGEETVSLEVMKGNHLTEQNITSLDQGMTRIPGVTIADGQVNIRGGSGWSYGAGSRVQVMMDNLPLLSADAGDAKWAIVPMENVEQIEVIKGAASALYGSGALNGIVNIRTAYPTDEPYARVSVYSGLYEGPVKTPSMKWWGNNNPMMGGVNFAYRQKFGVHDLVLGGAMDASTGYLDSSDTHTVRGTIKYRLRFKKIAGLSIGITASGYYSWGKAFFFWNGVDSNAYKPYPSTVTIYKNNRFTLDPFLEYSDKKNNHLRVSGRYFNATNHNSTGQGSVPNRYYSEVQYRHRFDKRRFQSNLIVGVVNTFDDVRPPKSAISSLFGKNTSYNFSAYVQADFKFFNRLSISLGARWDYFDMKHYVLDSTAPGIYFNRLELRQNSLKELTYPLARVGINYQPAEATFIRASFGQGFRYPTIAERYVSTNVGILSIASNPKLQPEKGYSAELGIRQGYKAGKAWTGFIDASGFWNQYDNMMEFTFGQFGDTSKWTDFSSNFGLGFSSQNIGKTRIVGGELVWVNEFVMGKAKLQLMAGYTYIDPRSLNWDDQLTLFNYQGVPLPLSSSALPGVDYYNQSNNPDSKPYLTYGQTSSSSKNVLKYRQRHNVKFDMTLSVVGLEWNTNIQYTSYMENIDYAFVGGVFTTLDNLKGTSAFTGLQQYRNEKEAIPYGKGKGDVILNMHLAYNFKAGIRVAFLVKNLLNWEYTPRPAYMEAPRNYTVQLSYVLPVARKK